jgi:hypothetical protein
LEAVLASYKIFLQPEKEEIHLQLLASMLANSNSNFPKKSRGAWQSFWNNLLKRVKTFH